MTVRATARARFRVRVRVSVRVRVRVRARVRFRVRVRVWVRVRVRVRVRFTAGRERPVAPLAAPNFWPARLAPLALLADDCTFLLTTATGSSPSSPPLSVASPRAEILARSVSNWSDSLERGGGASPLPLPSSPLPLPASLRRRSPLPASAPALFLLAVAPKRLPG